jgi:hypothetical protein
MIKEEDFFSELNNLKKLDQSIKEEIIKTLQQRQDIQNLNGHEDSEENLKMLFEKMTNSITNLDKINRMNLNNKTASTNEIARRVTLIDEIKDNEKKLNNYYQEHILYSKLVWIENFFKFSIIFF